MALFDKAVTSTDPPAKTAETAMAIYEQLKTMNGQISMLYSAGHGYPMPWIKWVYNDAKRLESEMIAYVIANPECSAGDVTSACSSDYLTVNTVGQDVIHYNPTFNESRTFAQFKAALLG